jgi:putative spermidine/putrescine transport system ATP-binding protein
MALARALAAEPRVLLLDEPFGALDAKVREELRAWLVRLHDEVEVTTIFVTHDQEEAMELSDQIVLINEGRVEQIGTPAEVYERPVNEFVADFVGTSNVIERGGRRVTIRPEKIRMLDEHAPDPGGDAEVADGVVREVVYLGAVTRFVVALDGGETLVALRQNLDDSAEDLPDQRGRRVRLTWSPRHAVAIGDVADHIPQFEEERR